MIVILYQDHNGTNPSIRHFTKTIFCHSTTFQRKKAFIIIIIITVAVAVIPLFLRHVMSERLCSFRSISLPASVNPGLESMPVF